MSPAPPAPPTGRPVATSLDELLAGAVDRRPMTSGDSRSGASFEHVTIGGEPHVVKHLHVDDDWIMRATGDLLARPVTMWRSGMLDRLPDCFDHAIVGVASGLGRNGWGAALLMRDVAAWLVPEGDTVLTEAQDRQFMDHMAALHAGLWGWRDDVGLAPLTNRLVEFSPDGMALEGDRGWPDAVPPLVIEGWSRFREVAGAVAAPVLALVTDPSPLHAALSAMPQTFLHGDWKLGNLGATPDGRTVLLDWAMPGQGCPTLELCWYLALNRARLPHPKEESIAAYRAGLDARGVATAGWWDRGLALGLLTGLVWFGWEKAFGGSDDPELRWWLERAGDGLACL